MPTHLVKLKPRALAWKFKSMIKRHLQDMVADKPQYEGSDASVLQCEIGYNRYGGYCVPRSSAHRPAAQKILQGDIWEPETISYMADLDPEADIVHAGTYFGDFLPALSKSRSTGSLIWAFEPNPENFRCAQLTTRINALDNVQLTNAGLGDEASKFPMETADANGRPLGGASRVVAKDTEAGNNSSIMVQILRVDDTIPDGRKIGLIQLDVEGFEQQALMGALATIERNRPVLILETLPEQAWLAEHLYPLGYTVTGTLHANSVLEANSRT